MDASDLERREGRGHALLLAHASRLDPSTPTARDRLDAALGPVLARKLVFALSQKKRVG